MVVLMSRNKSTRYPALFQFLSNTTFSYNSYGIWAEHRGTGTLNITQTENAVIGTTGNEAHGISARFSPADVLDDTNKIAINVKGTINTEGGFCRRYLWSARW